MEFNLESALEYYELERNSITNAAKKHCEEIGIPYEEKYRLRVSRYINSKKYDPDLENDTDTDTNQYIKTNQLSAVKEDGTIMNIDEYCEAYKIPREQVRTFKLVISTSAGRGAYYNIASNVLQGEYLNKFSEDLLEQLSKISNKPYTIKRSPINKESYLLVVDPADIHVGKLCDSFEVHEDYNEQIVVQRVKEGVQGILDKVKGFNIDQILFVGGNDVLHIDTPKRMTTSGTPQDTDGSWYSNFLIAKQLYVDILIKLLEVANVHFMYNPSNHDYMSGFFLADVIKTYFKGCKNITFDTSIAHRKYYKYHDNLIGTTHGDGAKNVDLGPLMAHESPDWSTCKHRYIYTHHVHHKSSKDYIGVTLESLRSPSGTDGWHDRNGFTGTPKAIEGFLHSKEFGQISRITHIF